MRKLLLVLSLTTLSLFGASFDCSKAKSDVEKMICKDDELSVLDKKLSLVFKEALQSTENKEQLKKEQLSWMKERNQCKDTVCIQIYYIRQIQTLSKIILDNAEAQKLLVLGDSYFTSYQQSNKEDDKIKGLKAYQKYIELLRTQNPLPKVPFRVVEEVYLKHKLELPYPDVWGYQFGDCKFGDPRHSFMKYLKNDDYLISYFEENPKATTTVGRRRAFLFFSQVEILINDKEEYNKIDPYWDRNFPIPSHFESVFPYKNPLKVNIDMPGDFSPFSRYVHIIDGEGKEYQYQPMLYCDKQISGYYLQAYSRGGDDINLTTHVADIASGGDIVPLKDESFLIRNGFTVVRFTKEGFSKAPFFKKTFFMPTREEYYAFHKKYVDNQKPNNYLESNITDDIWWFAGNWHQYNFDAAFEYLKSKKLIQGK